MWQHASDGRAPGNVHSLLHTRISFQVLRTRGKRAAGAEGLELCLFHCGGVLKVSPPGAAAIRGRSALSRRHQGRQESIFFTIRNVVFYHSQLGSYHTAFRSLY